MSKNRFYVDYENVHDAGLEGLEALKAEDEVYIFYSSAAKSIHMDKVAALTNSPAKVQLIEADTGTKNSLDFQLLTFLFGKMEEDATHIIISGDKGFEAAIKMAKRSEMATVKRALSIKAATAKGKARAKAEAKTDGPSKKKAEKASKKKSQKGQRSQKDQKSQKGSAAAIEEMVPTGASETASAKPLPTKPLPTETASAKAASNEPLSTTKRAQRERVQTFLESKGLELDKGSVTVVMNALTGSADKQSFYLVFLKALGQKKGLELYNQVKPHFLELRKLLG